MIESKYLEYFEKHKDSGLVLVGNVLLVEKVPPKEIKTASGLFLADATATQAGAIGAERPHWAIVLAVGAGYVDEKGNDVPLDVAPGDVVLLGQTSTRYFGTSEVLQDYVPFPFTYTPNSIGITRESEILVKAPGAAVGSKSATTEEEAQLAFDFSKQGTVADIQRSI